MKEVYRIKKGNLTSKFYEIPFDFGLIFEDEGIFFFDFYVNESFDLNKAMHDINHNLRRGPFSMNGFTESNNKVSATELSPRSIIPYQSKISMQSRGFLSHFEIDKFEKEEEKKEENRQTLFYLELEGLKMEYSDLTQTIRARRGVTIKDYNDWERDHSTVTLIYESSLTPDCNNFEMTFFKNDTNDNITVAFPNYRDNPTNILHYDVFQEFKRDFVLFLSLLNGAEVKIRKEYIGGFYKINVVGTQTVITYSFKTLNNTRFSNYIPLNDGLYRSDYILNHVFLKCFNKYVQENKKLDLNSIIFYLNGAEKSGRVEEKFFIQITALERLAKKYFDSIEDKELLLISDREYDPLKKELRAVLAKYKATLGSNYNRIDSKIGDLNKVKSKTERKFRKLFDYANIQSNKDIDRIVEEVRNNSVHAGEIGTGKEGIRNYLVLDQLLRDIVLNIIGYEKTRISSL